MRCGLAAGLGTAFLLASSSAQALKITVEPATPVPVGEARVFRVAEVSEAVGKVTYRCNFGDGTVVGPGAAGEVEHTYATPGHYTVIVMGTDAQKARTSASFVQAAHPALTQIAPRNSSSILYDASRDRIWNVNPDSHSVSVSDAGSLKRVREIPVGREPHGLALGPDGAIWVANQLSDEIVVLDPDSGQERLRIPLPYASQPRAIAFGPSGNAYVSLFATGELVEVDGLSHTLTRRLALGPTPAGVSVASDGRIFVTRFISPEGHGEVWLVSPSTFELVRTIELPLDPGPDTESSGRGLPNYVSSIAIAPDGTQAWVTAKKDNVQRGPQRDGLPMNPDSFVRAIVCVIDLATERELLDKRMDIDNRALPAQVAFSPVGDYAYLLLQGSNWLGIFDAYRAASISGIRDVGKAPDGLAFAADGKLFVNAFLSRALSVYDLRESLASRDHQAPEALARISSVDTEPLSEQVLLGKQVFYDASDKRMSEVGYMSCAACHLGGLGDGRVWNFTGRGEGLRNTKSLLGVAGAVGQGRLHWSANFDEVQDFERDIRESLGGTGFMTEADWLERRKSPLGTPSARVSRELDALAAYLASLDQAPRSPFRNADGSFSKDARAGRKLYLRAGCPKCHLEPSFTNSAGGERFDVGTLLPTSGQRLGAELVGLDTPSLKGLWQSAPYLHDGRASSLADVFGITQDQMGTTSDLSAAEMRQLVRYLQELDDVPDSAPAAETDSAMEASSPAETDSATEASSPAEKESAMEASCAIRPARAQVGDTGLATLLLSALGVVRRRQAPA